MAVYLIRQADGSFADTIIRAGNEQRAHQLRGTGETLHEVRDDVAHAMLVPAAEGRHDGALGNWLVRPTKSVG